MDKCEFSRLRVILMDNYRFSIILSAVFIQPFQLKKHSFHAEYILLEDLCDLQHHFYLQDIITVKLEVLSI